MKTRLLIIIGVVFALGFVGVTLPTVFAEESAIFVIDEFPITVNSKIVSEISLNWSPVHNLPEGTVTLSEPYDGIIEMNIPKSMPRTMNLDFGTELVVEGRGIKPGSISETESECFYNIQLDFKNSDYLEFGTMTVAAGRWVPVSIVKEGCMHLKNQISVNYFDKKLQIKEKNEQFDISYYITTGTITKGEIDCKTTSLKLLVSSKDSGNLQLSVPYDIFDGIFMVHVNESEWGDMSIDRDILTVNFPENTSTIEIFAIDDQNPEMRGICNVPLEIIEEELLVDVKPLCEGPGIIMVDGICQKTITEKSSQDDAPFFGIFVYLDNLISWIWR